METLPPRLQVRSQKRTRQTHARHSTLEPIYFTLFVSATQNPKRPPDVGSEASKNTISLQHRLPSNAHHAAAIARSRRHTAPTVQRHKKSRRGTQPNAV